MNSTTAPRPRLRVLTGCTAVGKTGWALRWSEQHAAEIVSCDSLLFYRGMDVGTAKPTPAERTRVRHHLIDSCELTEQMDVTRYVAQARAALTDIAGRGRTPLVVGGSGFYLRSFFGPVADEIDVPAELRAEVRALPLAAAVQRLRELNPAGLGALDLANPRRVSRALERCLASGRTVAELAADFARQRPPFADWAVEVTELDREPADLEQRIDVRVAQMRDAGLIQEVETLRRAGLAENPSASRAIGYREVIAYLDGAIPREQLAAEIAKNTRNLVKKQRTWFRTQLPPHRVLMAEAVRESGELFDG